jgi:hypothetical protein
MIKTSQSVNGEQCGLTVIHTKMAAHSYKMSYHKPPWMRLLTFANTLKFKLSQKDTSAQST